MCPRPLVWSEVSWTLGRRGTMARLSMFTPGMCFKHRSNNHNYNSNSITTINLASDKHHQQRPEAPDPGVPSGQARLCVSVCSEIGDKCLAVCDIMSPSVWCHEAEVTWPGCDRGAGQPGSPADCLDVWWSGDMMTRDKYADTKADNDPPRCFTQMNSICWSITQPQHAINFQSWRLVYSRKQYWHTQIHFQYLLWFLVGLF